MKTRNCANSFARILPQAAASPKRRSESPASSGSGSAAIVVSSPYTRRLLLDCDRLAHWLAGVDQYLESHVITVGDIFEHDEDGLRINVSNRAIAFVMEFFVDRKLSFSNRFR